MLLHVRQARRVSMPAACWPNEPHYRLFVFPRVRVRVFDFGFAQQRAELAAK